MGAVIFPISDDDRALLRPAYVTIALLVGNVLVFLYQMMNPAFTSGWSVIPEEIVRGIDLTEPVLVSAGGQTVAIPQAPGPSPIYLTILSAMFMHGGLMHLGGNMLFLWIFGDNVEHRFGHLRFLIFYLVSGIAATLAQVALGPHSVIPNLGASGAISGVMGAYLVLFPRNRVNAVFFFRIIQIPAMFAIGLWAVLQFVSGAGSLANAGETGGVAYAAHIGGFIAGVGIGLLARARMKEEPDSGIRRQYLRDDRVKRYW
jgi:membrane associated rhomboid family serine protease